MSALALFSTSPLTLIYAINNGNLAMWPMLMIDNAKQYLQKADAMAKGHLNQTHNNLRSTKPKPSAEAKTTNVVPHI
jgi:hypothetical protein